MNEGKKKILHSKNSDEKPSNKERRCESGNVRERVEDAAKNSGVSRRSFLKAAGVLGASLSMTGLASSLQIHSKYPVQYFNKTSQKPQFEVNSKGGINASSIGTDSVTFTDEITWPDGTTTTTSPGSDKGLGIASGDTVTIAADEHSQKTIPNDRSYDINGELDVDGSFVVQRV